jgi:ATP-dependent RNA helicase DOB1
VRDGTTEWGWGVVVNVVKKSSSSSTVGTGGVSSNYIVDTLLHCSSSLSGENGSGSKPCPPHPDEKGEMHVVGLILFNIFIILGEQAIY